MRELLSFDVVSLSCMQERACPSRTYFDRFLLRDGSLPILGSLVVHSCGIQLKNSGPIPVCVEL
jgi:hypothetical protein